MAARARAATRATALGVYHHERQIARLASAPLQKW